MGNLPHQQIADVFNYFYDDDGKDSSNHHNVPFMYDTAAASRNEHLIAQQLSRVTQHLEEGEEDKEDVFVITKVWYTYLGYNRTILSVRKSLEALSIKYGKEDSHEKPSSLRTIILLHWPRCYPADIVPWMRCEEEEMQLPKEVQAAGPPPHLHPHSAWKESWKALEDLYDDQDTPIHAIGVSNFNLHEMQELFAFARIQPHIVQNNVWDVLFNPQLIDHLRKYSIHFQAFNVMNGIFGQHGNRLRDKFPNAMAVLENIARDLSSEQRRNNKENKEEKKGGDNNEEYSFSYTAAQVVLKWLTVYEEVSVIPRASNSDHLQQNAPLSIAAIPSMTQKQRNSIREAVSALLVGKDDVMQQQQQDDRVFATFSYTNQQDGRDKGPIHIYWTGTTTQQHHPDQHQLVASDVAPGDSVQIETFPGHTFLAVSAKEQQQQQHFVVTAEPGSAQHFHMNHYHHHHHHTEL
eukprot:jgi/Bigna1/68348/fgenesh1_pg.6_\